MSRSLLLASALPLPNNSARPYRLTGNQYDVWAGHVLAPHSPRYNTGGYVRIDGALDVDRFEQAARLVVAGADALRIRIEFVGEEPRQSFLEEVECRVERRDFTGEKDPDGAALGHIGAEFRRPFDIYAGPFFHYELLTVARDRHYWLMKYHHLANDGWGVLLVVRRLAETYNALSRGEKLPTWNELSFRTAAEDDEQYRASTRFEEDGQYWQGVFSDIPAPTMVPKSAAGNMPAMVRDAGYSAYVPLQAFELDHGRTAALTALGASCGASFSHVFTAVLYTYFTQALNIDELVIGSATHNRRSHQAKNTVGMYVSLPPLRLSFGRQLTFTELIDRVRTAANANLRRQRYSLGDIKRRLGARRQQLFDIAISYLSLNADCDFDGSPATIMRAPIDDELSPLHFFIENFHADSGLRVNLTCRLAAFSEPQAALLRTRLDRLCSTVLDDPTATVARIPIAAAEERQRILTEFSGGTLTVAKGPTLVDGFERQAGLTPDAPAVATAAGKTLSYSVLNAQADCLAHSLRQRGIGAGDIVMVLEARTPELVVALLGILKAGAAYLPIEPATPAQRVGEILGASAARLLLTRGTVVGADARAELCEAAAAKGWSGDVLLWDEFGPVSGSGSGPVASRPGPDHPAYVIYTSGSTGAPKGVVVTHHNVVRLFNATALWFEFGENDVFACSHSYAFDFSVWEIWGALLHGGSVVLVSHETCRAPDDMARLIADHGVTVLSQTPSAFTALMQGKGARDGRLPARLRLIVFGGEPLQVGPVAEWFDRFGDQRVRLVNMYGITETTVHVTYQPLDGDSLRLRPDSVGEPIPDLTVRILNEHREIAPFGVPGEIYVGGAGVTLGYLHQQELTRDRFVPDPFSATPGAVLYRTGDAGILELDGRIRHRGRLDRQVQLRGYRVEPSEIESCLLSLPDVAAAAVIAKEIGPGDLQLIAFVVGADRAALEPGQLREYLRRRLPAYMVPGVIVPLAALPLTANGKTDLKQLAEFDRYDGPRKLDFTAPATRLERDIAAIWCDVLGLPRVGRDENFFDIGGHSLLSIKVHKRIERLLGREIAITALFNWPTIGTMAAGLGRPDTSEPESGSSAVGRDRAEQRRLAREQRLAKSDGSVTGAGTARQQQRPES
jgi:syringomycin synthetase protein SyrE